MSHLALAHQYWKAHLAPSDEAIDATCGNGHDTLFLSGLLPTGKVWALDIQEEALRRTEQRCKSNVALHLLSHEHLDQLPLAAAPRLVVYNLGYLPGSDKSIVTLGETTVRSLSQACELLSPDGALSILCYPGHAEGAREEALVLEWARGLAREKWQVCFHQWINRTRAPSLLWVTKGGALPRRERAGSAPGPW